MSKTVNEIIGTLRQTWHHELQRRLRKDQSWRIAFDCHVVGGGFEGRLVRPLSSKCWSGIAWTRDNPRQKVELLWDLAERNFEPSMGRINREKIGHNACGSVGETRAAVLIEFRTESGISGWWGMFSQYCESGPLSR
jgi:hypothetical protein